MKRIVLIISVLSIFFSCSEDPVSPKKEYPISHQDLSIELAFRINDIRKLLGNVEMKYLPNVTYEYKGEMYDFHTETSKEFTEHSFINISNEGLNYKLIRPVNFYLKNLDDIVDSLANDPRLITYLGGGKSDKEVKMAFNIMERENEFEDEPLFGLEGTHLITLYYYLDVTTNE